MKRRTSQKILKANRKDASSSKHLPMPSTASDSLKAPKRKPSKKNRQFGDDITNLQKQPVFQSIITPNSQPSTIYSPPKLSQIQPYLPQIEAYVSDLDHTYNHSILSKLLTKSSDSTEVTLDMRKVLVKWILQVGEKFKANQETIHITVQIIDYILVFSHKKITKTNFQLLGISALFVASKYNEIYIPEAKKYVYVCDGLYTLEDMFAMESYILTLTNFNLQFPTLVNFLGPLTKNSDLSLEFKRTVEVLSKIIVLDFNLFNRYKKLHVSGIILYLTARLLRMQEFSAEEISLTMNMDKETFNGCFSCLMFLYRQYIKPIPNTSNNQ